MKIYPAIDLIAGTCVRLRQGIFAEQTQYDADPIELAQRYAAAGAHYLHVVDLDGARSPDGRQTDLVLAMVKASRMRVQTGGGVRSEQDVRCLLDGGVDRVVIGSLAVNNPELTHRILETFGFDRITLALDVRLDPENVPRIAVCGWQQTATQSLWEIMDAYAEAGLQTVLCTDICRDGMLEGPNVELYAEAATRYPTIEVQASGGVCCLDDVRALRENKAGAVIVGKALLDERFTVSEVMAC